MTVNAAAEGSIIYLEDVTVEYDGFKALNALNFFMDYKELRVVIGPNGAGKTTLLDVITGKVQPSARARHLRQEHRPRGPARERDRLPRASGGSSRLRPSSPT